MPQTKLSARKEELRGMSDADLATAVEEARKAIYIVKRQRISKPVENVKAIRTNRKEIARALTIVNQRKLAAAKGQGS